MSSISALCMDYSLTTPARNILANLPPDEKVVAIQEDLSHDGYDKYGPESDLWDLDFITQKDDLYIYYSCHWENWFHKGTVKEYDIQVRNLVKNMLLHSYGFKKIVDLSYQDDNLRSYVRKLHRPKTIMRLLEISKEYRFTGEMAFHQLQDKSYLLYCLTPWSKEKEYIIREFDNEAITVEFNKFMDELAEKIKVNANGQYVDTYSIKHELLRDVEPVKEFKLEDIDTNIDDVNAKTWLKQSVTYMK